MLEEVSRSGEKKEASRSSLVILRLEKSTKLWISVHCPCGSPKLSLRHT